MFLGSRGQPLHEADLTTIYEPIFNNVGSSASHNPLSFLVISSTGRDVYAAFFYRTAYICGDVSCQL
jgi:hypothetical protein